MLRPHARAAWTAAAAAVLLLTTACGGDSDDAADDPIPGVGEETTDQDTEPDPTPDASDDAAAEENEEIELPADVELVFDWEPPEDPDQAAALEGAADYLRAIAHSVVAQDPEGGIYRGHSAGQALDYARTQVQLWVDGGWTMYGTDRYYNATTSANPANEEMVVVEFCNDGSQLPGKDVETGEVLPDEEQHETSVYHYSVNMAPAPGVEGFWQARGVSVEGDAPQCVE